jgi:predicted nucleic acid-binding protein
MTAKHLIDTDLYIDLIRSGASLPIIAQLYEKETPGIYFSSIVAQELLAGARSAAGRRNVEALLVPFEKAGRIVTPGHQQWRDAGDVLAKILTLCPHLRSKLPSLVNDCLLALRALDIGATLYTRNREDFLLLRRIRSFSLVVVA